jgi:uncharacterized LabA/DUF88 family protein
MNVFLLDADNLNSGQWLDEAFRVLEETEGQMPVRRAYGSADSLKALAETLRAWAVRPFVNLPLTKNTTDVALAVDAMELACQTPQPRTLIIGSGDADFVPLVVRLRERGIRMVCVSERSKMGREAVSAYDRVILVGQEPALQEAATPAPKAKAPAKRTSTSRKTVVQKAAVPDTLAAPTPAKKTRAKKAAAKTPVAQKTSASQTSTQQALPLAVSTDSTENTLPAIKVEDILKAVPFLQTGLPQHINVVTQALRATRLLGRKASSPTLFKKFPDRFELLPADNPNTVRYLMPQDRA